MRKLLPIFFFVLLLSIVSCKGPSALFTTSDAVHKAPAIVAFESTGDDIDSVHWDFGDGETSTEIAPVHQYTMSGNYNVTLTVMKGNKKASRSEKITVIPPTDNLVEISTPLGKMIVQLSEGTPLHTENFIKLVKEGYYDGLLFHRVIPEFMIQGGDPASKNARKGQALGSGGPGYTIPAEISDSLVHMRGAIAAARTGDNVNPERRSSGSQFYIVDGTKYAEESWNAILKQSPVNYTPEQIELYKEHGGAPFLDGKYTVFGRVIRGLEVIDKIAEVQRNPQDRPLEDIPMAIRLIR